MPDNAPDNGQQEFRDVRDAVSWDDRQAFTQHNVHVARTMAANEGWMLTQQIAVLIQERDTLLYSKGYGDHADGPARYLAGRIAGLEFALGLFGVKFA